MPFRSKRIPEDLSLNRLAEARERIGEVPYDLTVSNPTACGIPYPETLLAPLAEPHGLSYDPDPRGPLQARQAVAEQYRRWCSDPDPRRIVLTASTSEAYSFLFRTLCDPGDSVLVPSPSYPLFSHLAGLDGILAPAYRLETDSHWRIDFSSLEEGHDLVSALIVVHPNNPTGSFIHPDDRQRLVSLCRDRNWAVIADEVFLPFPIDGGPGASSTFVGVEDCLCCTLGGYSKSLGLPQLKLSWIVVTGPNDLVGPFLDSLDYVADAYLSVSTPVALAARQLFAGAAPVRDAISDRCRTNLGELRSIASDRPQLAVCPVGGGWSASLRVPHVIGDEELCLALLARGVGVHPGSFFGFEEEGWLVLSLLPPVDLFAEGVRIMCDSLADVLTTHSG
jgi:aspartate/methionine/tyrosine aminotransferase